MNKNKIKITGADPEETLHKSLATKDVYFYTDGENGFELLSREIFKKKKIVLHYPYNRKTGENKYKFIQCIEYHKMPETLPRGFLKTWENGYGFTRELSPLIYFLEEKCPIISNIIVSSKLASEFFPNRNKIVFNASDLDKAYNRISPLLKRHRQEINILASDILHSIFPKKFEIEDKKYVTGSLGNYIEENRLTNEKLSDYDIDKITQLIQTLPNSNVSHEKVIATKEAIDKVFIETILENFNALIEQKTETETLEKKWQAFFKENGWIFSQLFSYPMVIFKNQAYVGGKSFENKGGKYADFIYKSEFSKNLAIIEIKTHKSKLLEGRPYRGKDVFSISRGLSGAINQVLDRRHTLQKDFYSVMNGEDIESFNSKCIVVAGNVSGLKKPQLKSFELFRNSNKDVEIVGFDELRRKIEIILKLFSTTPASKG